MFSLAHAPRIPAAYSGVLGRSSIPLQIGEPQPKWAISVVDVRPRREYDGRAVIDGGTDRKDV